MNRLLIQEGEETKMLSTGGGLDWSRGLEGISEFKVIKNTLDEKTVLEKRKLMQVPRKPDWWGKSRETQERDERSGFLAWRARLAELNQRFRGTMTPFERNMEVWRQLWFVVDRSDVLVQVVDARDPSFFRSGDLAKYVSEKGAQEAARKIRLTLEGRFR